MPHVVACGGPVNTMAPYGMASCVPGAFILVHYALVCHDSYMQTLRSAEVLQFLVLNA